MKKLYFIALLFCLSISACKKDNTAPAPAADFSFDGITGSNIAVTQGTSNTVSNHSTNGSTYLWDFGDGTTSTEATPYITFKKGGNITISLTVKNSKGESSIQKKQVKVLVPTIHQITITDINKWVGNDLSPLTKFIGGDVWVEIYKSNNNTTYQYLDNKSYNYPLFYKSQVYTGVTTNNLAPLVINVPDKVTLDGKFSSSDTKYSYNLYVKDVNGTHLLFASDVWGSTFITDQQNAFTWYSSLSTVVNITGNWE
ncbi:PKD domain-containing protein [Pedobacter sp. L105]|uniref:PKD domain-containing protein n=1 Tax=Pedobacter sp. L105 TaxID=1641871 RepID=UPI00131A657E|nr:PKD domain-containing protein [Pedobacter sp. L105]